MLSTYLGGVHVGWGLVVGVCEHGDDRDEYRLHGVDGQPALGGLLVAPAVVAGLVKDGDAHVAVLVDVRVPDVGDHLEEEEGKDRGSSLRSIPSGSRYSRERRHCN